MPINQSSSRRAFLQGAVVAAGTATLAACTGVPSTPSITQAPVASFYPRHNERTKGWLRFLWQKATTTDDWSMDGDEPHPWWDQYTAPPYLSYPRFDLSDSSYAMLLMADQTPAWREVYTRIMDELATRHTAYWAAIDWNTFIGPSPDRQNYSAAMMRGWPERVRGNYDFPGWTANGVEPWGLQPDPIGADGNLFFRGWLNLVLGIYKYVSGDDKWERPWMIAGYENEHFEWTQPKIVEHLQQQYTDHPAGPHCENTKIWPFCNSAAGLGMYLSDQLGVTQSHGVFENWIEFAKDNYMGINDRNELEWVTSYYDPIENFKMNGSAVGGIGIAFYLLPQSPEIATFLYEAAANALGWHDPKRQIRPSITGLVMAKALGDHTAVARLSAAAEQSYEPRFFGDEMDRFGWWFNLDEQWPRGQRSAQMMIAEIGEGSWSEAFSVKHMDKYAAPTLEGVDFPNLGVDQAWNDKDSGILHIGTYVGDRSRRGQETSWQLTGLPNANDVIVLCDGTPLGNIEVTNNHSIVVRTDIDDHRYQIFTGYHGQQLAVIDPNAAAPVAGRDRLAARTRTAADNASAAESVILSGSANCPCCASTA